MSNNFSEKQQWIKWVMELNAIAQNGLAFCKDPFDEIRYDAIRTIAAEIASQYSNLDQEKIENLYLREQGYATPKIDLRGVVFQENKILLVKEKADGLWTLPGGWAEINESPSEAITREVEEESGFKTKAVKLLALCDKNKHDHPKTILHSYKCFFLCEIIGGKASPSIETEAVDFFSEDNIPSLSLPRVTQKQIHWIFDHQKHPEKQTYFD